MNQITVLIIDSSGDCALNVAKVLMPEGLSVLAANSTARARKMIASIQPALILADCSVEADPRVWVEEITRLEIPAQVIAVTSEPKFDEAMDWVADGVFSVLPKPLDEERLRRLALSALGTCETFQSVLSGGTSSQAKALAAFYHGLTGRLDIKNLKEYIITSVKALTNARRVELALSSSLTDALYCFETNTFSGLEDAVSDQGDGGPVKCRLGFELTANGIALGEMFLYFEEKSDLAIKERSVMMELVYAISMALQAVNKYQKAVNLAARDGLTGLYNRRIFTEVLKREFSKAKRHNHSLSLLSLDLDHFKSVNDNFGHQTGDMVLKAVAKVIVKVARTADLPARIGGEEFAVILPHTNQEQAYIVAERLKKSLEESGFDLDGTIFHQTISQGVVDVEHFMVNSPDDMVYWADQALYLAKREGRDTIRMATDLSITPVTKDGPYAFQ
ncbi:hypothetical protein C4J81_18000 [Deltaproteobacteria bacterium Smac51]|nr:hypothetical protein C4J81_18000 [Deltaproteobacteria bacterium Smac51]